MAGLKGPRTLFAQWAGGEVGSSLSSDSCELWISCEDARWRDASLSDRSSVAVASLPLTLVALSLSLACRSSLARHFDIQISMASSSVSSLRLKSVSTLDEDEAEASDILLQWVVSIFAVEPSDES